MIFRVDLKIFIFLILFYFTNQLEIYWMIMFFCILHEGSHLITGVLLKMKVKRVTIMPVGLSIEFALNKKDYQKKILQSNQFEVKKILVALAGPLSNLFVILLLSLIKENSDFINNMRYSNFLILLFNLLPIYPLDGGRILKSIFSLWVGKRKAMIYTHKISNLVLFLITFLVSILIYDLKNIALLFILVYVWYLVLKENKVYKMKIRFYDMLKYL